MFASLRRRVPPLGLIPRLCGIGICLLLALQSALEKPATARSRTVPSSPVVVAARGLPAGHVLVRADLRLVRWPRDVRPADAEREIAPLVGRRLAGPVSPREAVTRTRVLGPHLADHLAPGLGAVAVAVGDPHVVELVRAGDRVDLLAARRADGLDETVSAGRVTTLARGALALAVLRGAEGTGAEIVLAVAPSTAVAISRESASHVFTAVLAPP